MTRVRESRRVAAFADVPEREFLIVDLDGVEVGLTTSNGRVYAVRNVCPHQGAPICRGRIGGTMVPSEPGALEFGFEGLILRCPWHAWEFSLEDGKTVCGIDRGRLRLYSTEVRGEDVFVEF